VFKMLLISIVITPVLFGIQTAKTTDAQRGLVVLAAILVTYDVLYLVMLYYLRVRWLG
jgi:hypothetical protein